LAHVKGELEFFKNDFKKKFISLTKELKESQKSSEKARNDLAKQIELYDNLKDKLEEKQHEIDQVKGKVRVVCRELTNTSAKKDKIQEKLTRTQDLINVKDAEVERLKIRINQLELANSGRNRDRDRDNLGRNASQPIVIDDDLSQFEMVNEEFVQRTMQRNLNPSNRKMVQSLSTQEV